MPVPVSSPPPGRPPAAAAQLLSLVIALALTGCGKGAGPGPSDPARAPAPGPGSPGAPAEDQTRDHAGDQGAGMAAGCGDGRCVVRAHPATRVPLPPRSLLRDVRVQSIGPEAVTLTGRLVGDHHDSVCLGDCDVSTADGRFRVSVGRGGSVTENRLRITVLALTGRSAVLRLATR